MQRQPRRWSTRPRTWTSGCRSSASMQPRPMPPAPPWRRPRRRHPRPPRRRSPRPSARLRRQPAAARSAASKAPSPSLSRKTKSSNARCVEKRVSLSSLVALAGVRNLRRKFAARLPVNPTMSDLTDIPVVDLRDGGAPRHAQQSAVRARALRDACLGFFPGPARPLVPMLDRASRHWLRRSRSPDMAGNAQNAETLAFSGVWLLNASYQWGCTARAAEQDGVPWLIRTLDWPFVGLGRYAEVAHMRGSCGEFYSVTWPGYVGALTAMAPFRFAACVNQAPMRRRTTHRWLRPFDFVANAFSIWRCGGRLPPDQLLRLICENCADFAAARRMLETTPVARPVIYTLIGCAADQRCVIERTETGFVTREEETSAANDWVPSRPGWEGRIGTRRFLTSSFADARSYSRARRESLVGFHGALAAPRFDWVREPVLNPYTRLAVAMCPATGILRAVGYDVTQAPLPEPVTQMCEIAPPSEPKAA